MPSPRAMPARPRMIAFLLSALAGVGILVLFFRIWPYISWARVPLAVVVGVALCALQAREWRLQRTDRIARRRRWGLSRIQRAGPRRAAQPGAGGEDES